MKIRKYHVDTFATEIFKGNPAAVCPLDSWLPDSQLQAIAAEHNLAETAFFVKKDHNYHLRWFTPKVEIDLCGHATLATAYVIFNYIDQSSERVVFETLSGKLAVEKSDNLLSMEFPSWKPGECKPPKELLEGLGVQPREVLKSRDYLVVYDTESVIQEIKPNFEQLMKVDCLGIIITAEGEKSDFVSRFFAPGAGIPEDPVTGSAHCTLIPYWSEKLKKKKLTAIQLSERLGTLYCQYLGKKVQIAGSAVLYSEGFIYL